MTAFPNWSVSRQLTAAPTLDTYISLYALPPSLVYGLTALESGFDPQAYRAEPQINDASRGLMQLLYSTAQGLGYRGDPNGLYDPATNVELGTRLLRQLIDRYGDVSQALSAYNSGRPTGSTAGATYAAAVLDRAAYFDALWAPPGPIATDDTIDAPPIDDTGAPGVGGVALLLFLGLVAWRIFR